MNLGISIVSVYFRDNDVLIVNPHLEDKLLSTNTDNVLSSFTGDEENQTEKITWQEEKAGTEKYSEGVRVSISHPQVKWNNGQFISYLNSSAPRISFKMLYTCVVLTHHVFRRVNVNTKLQNCLLLQKVKQVSWHPKGDYMAVVLGDTDNNVSVLIHQLKKRRSQVNFFLSTTLFFSLISIVFLPAILSRETPSSSLTYCFPSFLLAISIHPLLPESLYVESVIIV